MTTPLTKPSLDDPRIAIPAASEWYEPAPTAQTERQAEFLNLRDGEMFVNMGPQHPSTHGVLRIVVKVNGEQVVDLDPVLGYLHRGVEKLCENADYHQAICYTDPLEYVASLFCEAAPVAAFEKLMDVEVPRRAQYIRVLTMELNRIASHTLFQGWMALDLGGITPILWSFIERDEIVDMLAALTGQKLLYNYYRIGGVNGDLNHEFMSRLGNWMSRAAAQIDSNLGLMNENEIFVRRTRGLGTLDAATALRMGVTGPNLRASGVPEGLLPHAFRRGPPIPRCATRRARRWRGREPAGSGGWCGRPGGARGPPSSTRVPISPAGTQTGRRRRGQRGKAPAE